MTFFLPYVAPYNWTAMLAFLAARAVPCCEQVIGATYSRSLRVQVTQEAWNEGSGTSGTGCAPASTGVAAVLVGTATVSDEPQRQALRLELSAGLEGGAPSAMRRIGQMFDVDCNPAAVAAVLGDLVGADRGLRLPGTVDPFEIAVRAILGQQVTVAAARTIATRLVAAFGTQLPQRPADTDDVEADCVEASSPPRADNADIAGNAVRVARVATGPTCLFPEPAAIARVDSARLGDLGIIRARGEAIIALARHLDSGTLRLDADAAIEPTLSALTSIRGIGLWTAHYIAMRALGWSDAFPPGDAVVLKVLGVRTPAAAAALARRWQPWRSYAVLHLWRRSALKET